MEENISENRQATAKISHSSKISEKECLDISIQTQLNGNPQACEISAKTFKDKDNSMKNTMEKIHICNVCGLVFFSELSLLNHLLLHSNQQNSVCEECGRTLSERRNLICHLLIHTSEKSFICDVCGKSFKVFEITFLHSYERKALCM
ncbi:hypothetical protein AVEN_236801-1 [Araneus ventricosus]|uniref:C2H2-type domain-containing protein n=1 Tax=Araneus ventricosus TaxID=182803 RepID=A0A4Y2K8N4_ARAVE|nr:hypothetical protein AVEN_236801-1 [Araneus ventricosus]